MTTFMENRKLTLSELERTLALEGIVTTRKTIAATIAKWRTTRHTQNLPRSGRPTMIPKLHQLFIEKKMQENDELTAADLLDLMIARFGRRHCGYSKRTLARARKDLGWTFNTVRYCQAIREGNKAKRLEWCKERLDEGEMFDDVIFTDECTVQLDRHRRRSYRKKGSARKLKCKHKHPQKIHVWAGISKRGATQIVIFDGILTAVRYADILTSSLLPFIWEVYPAGHRLYQDNDPKHTSRYIRDYFNTNNIIWWKSPAESPDLNPIEMVWGSMKTFLRDRVKPKNLEELKVGIKEYWGRMTPELCSRYIDYLQKVLPVVLEVSGGPSGH